MAASGRCAHMHQVIHKTKGKYWPSKETLLLYGMFQVAEPDLYISPLPTLTWKDPHVIWVDKIVVNSYSYCLVVRLCSRVGNQIKGEAHP